MKIAPLTRQTGVAEKGNAGIVASRCYHDGGATTFAVDVMTGNVATIRGG